jgi:predicted hydrocarbon binding protein
MFNELIGPSPMRLQRRPLVLTINDSLTARADPGAAACTFYTGAFAELLLLYTGKKYRVSHPDCGARSPGKACAWTVEIAS